MYSMCTDRDWTRSKQGQRKVAVEAVKKRKEEFTRETVEIISVKEGGNEIVVSYGSGTWDDCGFQTIKTTGEILVTLCMQLTF